MSRELGLRAVVGMALVCAAAPAEAAGFAPLPALHGDEGTVMAAWGSAPGDVTLITQLGLILHTSDGGRTWSRLKLDARDTSAIWGAGKDLYVLGPGVIYHSGDGATWTASRILNSPTLRGIWGSGADDVWVVGDKGSILHTLDRGASWLEVSGRTQASLTSVWGAGGHVFVVGVGGMVLHSSDGGRTFLPESSGVNGTLLSVWGTGPNDVWAVGEEGTIVHSDGKAWGRQAALSGFAGTTLTSVWGDSSKDIYVCGGGGVLLHWDGRAWTQVRTGTAGTLRTVWGSGPTDVWVAGDLVLHSLPEVAAVTPPPTNPNPNPNPNPTPNQIPNQIPNPNPPPTPTPTPPPPPSAPPPAASAWVALESGAKQPLTALWGTGGSLFAVGQKGQVLHSTDEGASFTAQSSGTDVDLHAVWGASRNDVWIGGDRGKILRSTDEGQTWIEQPLGLAAGINGIWGADAKDIWLVGQGGLVLHSPDSGRGWRAVTTGTTADLHAVWGTGKNDVWVVGDAGTILHLTNGGATFAKLRAPAGSTFRSVSGGAARDVWVAGDAIVRSTDGGRTFRAVTIGGVRGFVAERIWPVIGGVVIGGSADGAGLVLSTDGTKASGEAVRSVPSVGDLWGRGNTLFAVAGASVLLHGPRPTPGLAWGRQQVAEGAILNRVWGSAPDDVYVVGDKGFIARSTDRGHSWQPLSSGTTENLNGVWGSGAGDVYAVGQNGTILHSGDRGATWTAQHLGTKDHLNSVWGSGPDDVYAVGTQGTALGGIFHSTDGGKSWLALMGGGRTFWGVWGTGKDNVYVVAWDGASGVILRSENAGKSWGVVKTGDKPFPYLTSVWGSSPQNLYAVGFGVILHSRDGGRTWGVSEHATGAGSAGYGGLWGSGPNDVFLTADGYVFHSTDDGKTFQEWRSPLVRTGAIWGTGPNDVYVAGDGEVYHATGR